MQNVLNTALVGYTQNAQQLDRAASAMTPNNPEGFEKSLLEVNQAETHAQVNLKVIKSWNENIGRLLDILA